MLTPTKEELALARRQEAKAFVPTLRPLVARLLVRDERHIHITLWLTKKGRGVDWWPGSAMWSPAHQVALFGNPDALHAWIINEKAGAHAPRSRAPDDFDLVDIGDRF